MISEELEVSLHMAFVEARTARHEFITVEHLLLSLLDNAAAVDVLRACAANLPELRQHLRKFVADNTPVVEGTQEVDTQPTLGFQRVIQRAIMHVSSSSTTKTEVTGAHVLVAMYGEKDSHAIYYLHQQGVTRLDVVNYLSHGVAKDANHQPSSQKPEDSTEPSQNANQAQTQGQQAIEQKSPLDLYTNNLNEQAQKGQIK